MASVTAKRYIMSANVNGEKLFVGQVMGAVFTPTKPLINTPVLAQTIS